MALTDVAVRRTSKPGKYSDGRGLYLQVAPTGGRYWRYSYRYGGKQKTLALGTYPDVGLGKAREKHQSARSLLAEGIDPSAQKKAAKANTSNSFEALSADWLSRQTLKKVTRDKLNLWLERDCAPLRHIALDTISARDILAVARVVEASSADRARRIVALCGQVMRFGVATGIAERDPTGDLRGALAAPPGGNFTAITDPGDFARLLRALYAHTGHPLTVAALKLSALTFTRPGCCRQPKTDHLNG